MKPGPFVTLLALLARVDEKTLSVLARALRDADLLDKGGRGRSGIEVDAAYLATVLIARMGTDKPARAVEAFQRFAGMQLLNTGMHGEVASLLPDPDHSLLDFMVRICDPALDLNVTPEFEVSFVGAAAVDVIRAGKTVLMYGDRAGLEHDAAALAEAQGDAEREEKILFRAYMGKNALHGIVESRSFTSTWLQGLKSMVFAARGGG